MDYVEIANQVIEYLKPVVAAGPSVAASAAGSAFWDWIKERFTRPAAAEAVKEVAENPASETNWDALKVQIRKAMEEDGGFRKDLVGMLPKELSSVRNTLKVHGSDNVVVQSTGGGNVNIRR